MEMKDEDIFDILDGVASEEVRLRHEQLLAQDEDYKILFKELLQTHELLLETPLEKPAFNFTDNLIDKWEAVNAPVPVKKPNYLPFYFLGGMAIFIVLAFSLVSVKETGKLVMMPNLSSAFSIFESKALLNVLLISNSLLLLSYLDKRILKPYFQHRFVVKH
ncbi:hypothetical protein SAMN04515674_1101 [Pseudarcicella hirudinis]|uniref:Uncharacterized protein n=2 Tax=Pseudarcicella hirudinis TaxID=1079859 RepID=A0A1I5VQ40_9BACT|nr:hypothetical protein [Pseudarcicella hirudinis]SFQ09678.1 hypothetical protein SAMN04515674_1101 [Pseudarcicella hirudinis]